MSRRPLFGWFLLLTGTIWLLAEMRAIPEGVSRWWPLAVVALAVVGLARAAADHRPRAVGAYITALVLGVFWVARERGLVDDALFLPVLVIALGLGLILRRLVPDRA
jgi:hypothetical protein